MWLKYSAVFLVGLAFGVIAFLPTPTSVRLPSDTQSVFYVGDSKINAYLITETNRALMDVVDLPVLDYPAPLAAGGWTVGRVAQEIARGALDIRQGSPRYVLINLGANDADDHLDWSQWAQQYTAIVDAAHERWPEAQIFAAYPWRRGFEAECDHMAAIIDLLISERDWLHQGVDERLILPDATRDGTHPLIDTYPTIAQAWAEMILNA